LLIVQFFVLGFLAAARRPFAIAGGSECLSGNIAMLYWGLVLVLTSNRIGLPLSDNLRSSVKLDGNDQVLGSLEAAISKLRPYALMADDKMAADMMSETPATSETITEVFFIKCRGA
jgi:hypothetical protein